MMQPGFDVTPCWSTNTTAVPAPAQCQRYRVHEREHRRSETDEVDVTNRCLDGWYCRCVMGTFPYRRAEAPPDRAGVDAGPRAIGRRYESAPDESQKPCPFA